MPSPSPHLPPLRTLALLGACATLAAAAHAEPAANSIQLGAARAMFNVDSGNMWGPPGTTPGGIQADVKDKTVLAMVYERRIEGPWSITFQGGLPPVLSLQGAGVASSMGTIGTVRAWFPAVMGTYSWNTDSRLTLHAGAGLHYTFFTDGAPNGTYNTAFGGTASRASFSPNLGPIVKLGATWNFDSRWFVDLSYSRYWIRTTATIDTDTPGVGTVQRKVKVRTDPDVVSLTLGYRF